MPPLFTVYLRMHYVSVEELTKSYGIKPLFQHITFHIEEGDKIALVCPQRQREIHPPPHSFG